MFFFNKGDGGVVFLLFCFEGLLWCFVGIVLKHDYFEFVVVFFCCVVLKVCRFEPSKNETVEHRQT